MGKEWVCWCRGAVLSRVVVVVCCNDGENANPCSTRRGERAGAAHDPKAISCLFCFENTLIFFSRKCVRRRSKRKVPRRLPFQKGRRRREGGVEPLALSRSTGLPRTDEGHRARKGAKRGACGTTDSHVVPHRSTEVACSGLTSQIGRDTVRFTEYGRRRPIQSTFES